jgi:4-hydroxybenzoyl-CoA thioesterase
MIVSERIAKFEEVDAAGIVFFAHFVTYAHEAMEQFFGQVEGGYVALIMRRRIGFPAVKLTSEFHAPVRYGDRLRIETTVAHLGNRSARFRYRMKRMEDDELAAELEHTVVITDLEAMRSIDMPADVRAALSAHLEEETS